MASLEDLKRELRRIDGRGYRAYKDVGGRWTGDACEVLIDHVQGDPFAAPSRLRIRVANAWPIDLFENRVRRIALEDWLARRSAEAIRRAAGGRRGSGKSGLVAIDSGGQEVVERTAVALDADGVEARLEVGLPARGRSVLGREAEALLCEVLPEIAQRALEPGEEVEAADFVDGVECQEALRAQLRERGACPRASP